MLSSLNRNFSTSINLLKLINFNLTDVGEGIKEVEVKQWFCKPGDEVIEFDPICEVTSDKATVEISSKWNGKIGELFVPLGKTAKVGKPLFSIDIVEKGAKPAAAAPKAQAPKPQTTEKKPASVPKFEQKATSGADEPFNEADYVDLYQVDDHKADFSKYRDYEYKYVYSYDKNEIDVANEKCLPKMNMLSAISNGLMCAMAKDPKVYCFGEDVAFGGVFRATEGLKEKFGEGRVFNAPLTEQGIVGFGIGMVLDDKKAVCEIQFGDFIFTALDQIVSEASKMRYRNAGMYHCGGLTVRCAMGHFGHGAIYHSQVVESFFAPSVGLKIVVPRNPVQAKGLLASCIDSQDPCLFLEHKLLYRMAASPVPERYYKLPLGKAEIIKPGKDLTVIGWGAALYDIEKAAAIAEKEFGASIEIIDLRTLVPYDEETLLKSVKKTGRCLVVHEGTYTGSFAADITSFIQERCFYHLDAPATRLCALDTPVPLYHEKCVVPDDTKIFEMMKKLLNFK